MARRAKLDFPDRHERTVQPRLWIFLGGLVLVVSYLIAFALKNNERSEVDFVFWTAHTSRVWILLISLGIGLLAGVLLSQLYRHRQGRRRQAPDELAQPLDTPGDLPG